MKLPLIISPVSPARPSLSLPRIALALFFPLLGVAHAASITVTTTVDVVDGNTVSIAALIGTPGGAGISLREAIIAANNTAGADTITLPAGAYTLTRVGNDATCTNGDLDINDSLTITGAGAATTIVQGASAYNPVTGVYTDSIGDKVMGINQDGLRLGLTVSISGITVRWGQNTIASNDPTFAYTGAGVDVFFTGTGNSATFTNCVFTENYNVNAWGGGVNVDSGASFLPGDTATNVFRGTATFTGCIFSNNRSGLTGAGLNLFADKHDVNITNCSFTGNNGLGDGAAGGGINIRHTNGGTVSISGCTVSGNTGRGSGGGIGIFINQIVNIQNTAIVNNSALNNGVTSPRGGGLINESQGATTLTNVLIAGNSVQGGTGTPEGGGLSNSSALLVVRNTTISGNTSTGDAGGFFSVQAGANATLTNVTLTNNRADNDNNATGQGGGIKVFSGTVTLQNSIVAGNFKGPGAVVDEIIGAVTANFSLIGNLTGATVSGANNLLNVAAPLATLAGNGGPSVGATGSTSVLQTHALLINSPALDAGSNALVPVGITTDQRGTGFARILDSADTNITDTVDLGALEQHPSIQDVAEQTMNEDGSLGFAFNLGDTDLVFDSVTATSSNTTLVPNNVANINVTGSGSTRTVTINPASNKFGATTITLTVTDTVNGAALSMSDTFVLTVNPVADPPAITSATTPEDTQSTSGLVISRNAGDGAEVTHFKITTITGGTLFKNNGTTVINNNDFITFTEGNAGLKFTPTANLNTLAGNAFSFAIQAAFDAVGTGISTTTTATLTVTEVNDPPAAGADPLSSVAEDSGIRVIAFATLLANDSRGPANEGSQTLTISAVSSPVGGSVAINGSTVEFTPTLNFNGAASFNYTVQDNGTTNGVAGPKTAVGAVTFTITPVNDPPVITGQAAISTTSNTSRVIAFTDLTATDGDNTYPTGFTLTVSNGTNYTRAANTITPALNFYGTLSVPAQVNDGTANSNLFNLVVTVNPDPAIVKASPRIAPEPGGGFRVTFIGNPGQTYTIQFTPSLLPLSWQFLGIRTADANGNYSIVDIPPANTPKRFYRAILP